MRDAQSTLTAAAPPWSRAVVRALVRGYYFAIDHPATAAAELEARVPGLDPALVGAELRALLPAFGVPVDVPDPARSIRSVLAAWARWELRFGSRHASPRRSRDVRPELRHERGGPRAPSVERGTTRSNPASIGKPTDVALDV